MDLHRVHRHACDPAETSGGGAHVVYAVQVLLDRSALATTFAAPCIVRQPLANLSHRPIKLEALTLDEPNLSRFAPPGQHINVPMFLAAAQLAELNVGPCLEAVVAKCRCHVMIERMSAFVDDGTNPLMHRAAVEHFRWKPTVSRIEDAAHTSRQQAGRHEDRRIGRVVELKQRSPDQRELAVHAPGLPVTRPGAFGPWLIPLRPWLQSQGVERLPGVDRAVAVAAGKPLEHLASRHPQHGRSRFHRRLRHLEAEPDEILEAHAVLCKHGRVKGFGNQRLGSVFTMAQALKGVTVIASLVAKRALLMCIDVRKMKSVQEALIEEKRQVLGDPQWRGGRECAAALRSR